jgi:hypothetical protein
MKLALPVAMTATRRGICSRTAFTIIPLDECLARFLLPSPRAGGIFAFRQVGRAQICARRRRSIIIYYFSHAPAASIECPGLSRMLEISLCCFSAVQISLCARSRIARIKEQTTGGERELALYNPDNGATESDICSANVGRHVHCP